MDIDNTLDWRIALRMLASSCAASIIVSSTLDRARSLATPLQDKHVNRGIMKTMTQHGCVDFMVCTNVTPLH
jgi:hypothetical protein